MQNIVTWGQNMSANIEEFACFSMGGLFSGVPPSIVISEKAPINCEEVFFTFYIFCNIMPVWKTKKNCMDDWNSDFYLTKCDSLQCCEESQR